MVDTLSIRSGTTGVADRTTHEQATGDIEEGEAASLGFRTHHGDDLLDAFGLLALVCTPRVHLSCFRPALASRRRLDAESLQEFGEFGAGAGWWWRTNGARSEYWMP
jgi:hypothetical protein